MERHCSLRGVLAWATSAALLLLLLPVHAEAKLPVEQGASEAPTGITVRGIGFADGEADATRRAVRDARGRAVLIARVLGLQIGRVEGIDLPAVHRYGIARGCRSLGKPTKDCRRPGIAAASVTFQIVGSGTAAESARTVRATGAASAAVEPLNRTRSRSIKRALLAARRGVTPEAAAVALRKARSAASAANLQLGPVIAVAEAPPPYYYGPNFQDDAIGTFGPGRFCGIVRRPVVRRDPETGVPKVVRRVPKRRCFVPSHYDVRLEIQFQAA